MRKTGLIVVLSALFAVTASMAQLTSPGWGDGQAERVDPGQLRSEAGRQPVGAGGSEGLEGTSSEVSELARGLQYDPVRIFNYVHNHIEYTPYFGLLKGAGQTLLERSGNDFDQCVLLVALLEESGYLPVYVYGTMHMPMFDVDFYDLPSWLITLVLGPAVEDILSNGGIPYAVSSQVQGYEIDRLWVEVDVDGQTRRLDPAFKRHYGRAGEDLEGMLGYSRTALLSEASGQTGVDFVQHLNQAGLFAYLDGLTSNLLASLESDHPNASLEDLLGDIGIHTETVTNLPTALRFVSSSVATWTAVPDSYTHEVTITHGEMPAITKKTHEIAGRRLSITYGPEAGAMSEEVGGEPQSLPPNRAAVAVDGVAETATFQLIPVLPPIVTNTVSGPPVVLPDLEGNQLVVAEANEVINFGKISPYSATSWIGTWGVSGSGSIDYWVRLENASSAYSSIHMKGVFTLPAGQLFTMGVQFSGVGQSHGKRTGKFKVSWRPSQGVWRDGTTWDLTGEVAKAPEIWFSGEAAGYTDYHVPFSTTLNFHNDGSEGLIIKDYMTMSGGSPDRFSFQSGHVPFTMPHFSARHIDWVFDAAEHGPFSTQLDFPFTYDNMDYHLSSLWNISFLGEARYVPDLTGSYGVDFGSNGYGISSEGTCLFKNNGLASQTLTGISLIGSGSARFQLLSGGETGPLDIGAERQIQVRYKADQLGSHSATLRIDFSFDGRPFYYELGLIGTTVPVDLATLWLEDDMLATETGPVTGSSVELVIDIDHPYAAFTNSYADAQVTYPLQRGALYTLIHGFGGTTTGLPLERRQRQLEAYRAQGLLDTSREVMTESLHCVGQGWIEQTALGGQLLNRLARVRKVTHHRFGLMAQEQGYYVDVKAQFGSGGSSLGNEADSLAAFRAGGLIQSAMEHGILEQMQGVDRPGASTVKLLSLANAEGSKIYLADSNNYPTVASSLVDYSTEELAEFNDFVNKGGILVLPEAGRMTLNEWTGKGYIGYGSQGNHAEVIQMIISGDYGTQSNCP